MEQTDLLTRPQRLLHVAPERCFQRRLQRVASVAYLTADYDSSTADEDMNITNIQYPDASFDSIICNHVLHYVDDDRRAMRELYRVLVPGGWAMLQSPVDEQRPQTLEDEGARLKVLERARFGPNEYARVYGRDYVQRLEQAGFTVRVDRFARQISDQAVDRFGLDPKEAIYLCCKRSAREADRALADRHRGPADR